MPVPDQRNCACLPKQLGERPGVDLEPPGTRYPVGCPGLGVERHRCVDLAQGKRTGDFLAIDVRHDGVVDGDLQFPGIDLAGIFDIELPAQAPIRCR
jgi:hypothetical protein